MIFRIYSIPRFVTETPDVVWEHLKPSNWPGGQERWRYGETTGNPRSQKGQPQPLEFKGGVITVGTRRVVEELWIAGSTDAVVRVARLCIWRIDEEFLMPLGMVRRGAHSWPLVGSIFVKILSQGYVSQLVPIFVQSSRAYLFFDFSAALSCIHFYFWGMPRFSQGGTSQEWRRGFNSTPGFIKFWNTKHAGTDPPVSLDLQEMTVYHWRL